MLPGVERVPLPARAVAVTSTFNRRTRRRVPLFVFLYPKAYYTVVYSHGNAADCGFMKDHYAALAFNLRVNVVAYEYCGYGASRGTFMPTEASVCSDADAAVEWVLAQPFCRTPDQLILYGQSVGSGPTCAVAATRRAHLVILHSPIMSGLRVVTANRCLACCDIFPNIDRIGAVAANAAAVFILHGQADEEVPVYHGERLFQALPDASKRLAPPWFPPHAGHNNILDVYWDEYFRQLRNLLFRTTPRCVDYADEPVVLPARLSAFASRVWMHPNSAPEPPGMLQTSAMWHVDLQRALPDAGPPIPIPPLATAAATACTGAAAGGVAATPPLSGRSRGGSGSLRAPTGVGAAKGDDGEDGLPAVAGSHGTAAPALGTAMIGRKKSGSYDATYAVITRAAVGNGVSSSGTGGGGGGGGGGSGGATTTPKRTPARSAPSTARERGILPARVEYTGSTGGRGGAHDRTPQHAHPAAAATGVSK